jgi:excisionase family DNA binding protein
MKPGNTQFGLRENTASSRQHDSRVAVQSVVGPSEIPSAAPQDHVPALSASSSQESVSRFPNNAAHAAATRGEPRHEEHLLTVREVADLLQVPASWVYARTRKRSLERIPSYRLGKYWRFRESDVVAWLGRQQVKGRTDA